MKKTDFIKYSHHNTVNLVAAAIRNYDVYIIQQGIGSNMVGMETPWFTNTQLEANL